MKWYIKAMVEQNNEYDIKQKKMVNVGTYLYNPCGSDYTHIIHGLKTLTGVKKRISDFMWREDTIELHICDGNENVISIINDFKRMNF